MLLEYARELRAVMEEKRSFRMWVKMEGFLFLAMQQTTSASEDHNTGAQKRGKKESKIKGGHSQTKVTIRLVQMCLPQPPLAL